LQLLDVLYTICLKIKSKSLIYGFSCHMSRTTNTELRQKLKCLAYKSLKMLGEATEIRIS
jgi:uncharacterized protein YcbK (DUF882 family)